MSITKEQILETISKMSVMNIVELVSEMEKKFGISVDNMISNTNTKEKEEKKIEKTEFDVFLKSIGPSKVSVIRAVRTATGLGLKDAKDLVESAPALIKEKINKKDAENLQETLKKIGAEVEIK